MGRRKEVWSKCLVGLVQDWFRPEQITLVQNWFRDRTMAAGLIMVLKII